MATFTVEVEDTMAPDITVPDELFVQIAGPAGTLVDYSSDVSASDEVDPAPDLSCTPASGGLFAAGITTVNCVATDAAGNAANALFDVTVGYANGFGITPNKLTSKAGSSNTLNWGWTNENGDTIDTSSDTQLLSIVDCDDGTLILSRAGDPGSSDFRVKSNLAWEFIWQSDDLSGNPLPKGTYCASVTSALTTQSLQSPPIRLR